MTPKQLLRAALMFLALVLIVASAVRVNSVRAAARAGDNDEDSKRGRDNDRDSKRSGDEDSKRAHDDDENNAKVQIGFQIAPVELNLRGKDRELVGLGSYIVNSVAGCNGCHSAGPPTQYAPGGNPFFGQPTVVNKATYLGGGRDFGPLIPGSADIVSRNLTPDKTGMPEGGHSFADFLQIMRHGTDLDGLHPECSGAPNTNCIPPPFNGSLLQIMPWPEYQAMTNHDLRAIYEYLSAIPCVAGPASGPLHNDCP